MTFEVDVSPNVPLFGQESCVWCGAASAQMIMDGYPDPARRFFFPQSDIWDTIQLHNSTDPADDGWATDPYGLRDALMTMNPPPSPHSWVSFEQANSSDLISAIAYWMKVYRYPVATLINQGGHWVVLVRYVTDVEPTGPNTPVNLQFIEKYDPEPHNIGTISTMTAGVWMATDWVGPVRYAGSWLNKYVAIVEPPEERIRISVKKVVRTGKKMINLEAAVDRATKALEKFKFHKLPRYSILSNERITNLEPVAVREQVTAAANEVKDVPHYYIVPFGLKGEEGQKERTIHRMSIIVNAFTGEFEEITAFGRPVSYLSDQEAIRIAKKTVRVPKAGRLEAGAELIYQPSDITHIRTYPFWKVTLGKKTVYVDQLGKIYTKIKPSVPGD
jgi:hypothetical protein